MLALGYSINLLTLLALVLAIGLVVDDAIIVVENVDRHLKEEARPAAGRAPRRARARRPDIAMTIVLVAAYVPIGFQGGLTGALFTEFAFTLAGAVTVSAVIALTPLTDDVRADLQHRAGERALRALYRPQFTRCAPLPACAARRLATWSVPVVMGVLLFGARSSRRPPSRSSPRMRIRGSFSTSSWLPRMRPRNRCTSTRSRCSSSAELPEYEMLFQITQPSCTGLRRHAVQALERAHPRRGPAAAGAAAHWAAIAGGADLRVPAPLAPGRAGAPLQFVINSTEPFQNLNEVAQAVLIRPRRAACSGSSTRI